MSKGNEVLIAVEAVRFAKTLHAWGCQVHEFMAARTGSCYLTASVRGVRFLVRVSDHRPKWSSSQRAMPHYSIRADRQGTGTRKKFSTWLTEAVRGHYCIDATPSSAPEH